MVKKVLVVNDIPGAGKVAANVNMPILSAGGLEVSILPTMLISTQTGESYTELVRHELATDFKAFLDVWEKNDIHFDIIMTGYFSTVEQVEQFEQYYAKEKQLNPNLMLVMDPIMADHGIFYPGFDDQIAKRFAGLMQHADIVLPNITEACFITNTPYSETLSLDQLRDIGQKLLASGVKYSVITGVRLTEDQEKIGFLIQGADQTDQLVLHKYYPQHFFGTGDIVVSAATVWYSRGESIEATLEKIGEFIELVLEHTIQLDRELRWGINFEPFLYKFFD